MPGFDENPFGEPTIDNPFAVRLRYVKLRWLSFTYVCIFLMTVTMSLTLEKGSGLKEVIIIPYCSVGSCYSASYHKYHQCSEGTRRL
jgi:hypothetical protein